MSLTPTIRMRNNLSSKIALTHVQENLYKPRNSYEQSVVTRYEKIPTNIYATAEEAAQIAARCIATDIKSKQATGQPFTLAVASGNSPIPVLKELIRIHKEEKVSFSNVHLFSVYEFYPIPAGTTSFKSSLQENFLDHVDIPANNLHIFNGQIAQNEVDSEYSKMKEALHQLGGLDYMLLGLGRLATIGMNLPGSLPNSPDRLTVLDQASREEASRTFNNREAVPPTAITMGMATILSARKIILVAWGEVKASSIQKIVEGPITDSAPASYLQTHAATQIYCDLQAATELTRIRHPWLVTSCKWNNKLIRRAIVWLCQITGKPILKLTNKDYSEHQLNELLTEYGSAYNVNIQVFNDIQHTITGWPGGKPGADDTNRPERATPNPKRVLIFSPHPDDDVISMGGTFHRLVEQGHDVHVAYQTSGNIAVGDEEVIRYLSLIRNLLEIRDPQNKAMLNEVVKMRHFLLHEKQDGAIETPEVRLVKGQIRREEARTACRFVGIEEDHVHFLDLPFYETGAIKKGDLTQKDIDIIINLFHEIKPQQIFVAGDLADPHGTHKVCLDAILAAIDQTKHEEWFSNCWVWMYRGAWAEWEIDHIEMAVPMSPEQLRFKRNSILKHQSQMESAPFLGSDERLFWQRAEDRNKATAELYHQLGLASYEAIEAFVRYHPVD